MLELVDLFPRTIGVTQLQSIDSKTIASAIKLIDDNVSVDMDSDGGFTKDQHLLDKPIFAEIKAEILRLGMQLSKAYSHEVEELGICNSWGNVVGKGQQIHYHRHSNSYISGSFYLTEGSMFSIINGLSNELFGIMPKINPDAQSMRSLESLKIEPKPGRIVLFPSGLYHSVLPSQDNFKRYSIAFNLLPLGLVGKPTSLMNIQLVT